jgi:hypothetical protein
MAARSAGRSLSLKKHALIVAPGLPTSTRMTSGVTERKSGPGVGKMVPGAETPQEVASVLEIPLGCVGVTQTDAANKRAAAITRRSLAGLIGVTVDSATHGRPLWGSGSWVPSAAGLRDGVKSSGVHRIPRSVHRHEGAV